VSDQPESEIRNTLIRILDTFSGTDGGIRFIKLRFFLESLERDAKAGDSDAERILEIVRQFDRLIDIAGSYICGGKLLDRN
jgi:hypothetical protein